MAVNAVLSGELSALPLEELSQGGVEVLLYALELDRLLAALWGEGGLVSGRVPEHATETSDVEVVPARCFDRAFDLVSANDTRRERL